MLSLVRAGSVCVCVYGGQAECGAAGAENELCPGSAEDITNPRTHPFQLFLTCCCPGSMQGGQGPPTAHRPPPTALLSGGLQLPPFRP